MSLSKDDQVGVALAQAIRAGDLESLARLLSEQPGLASARIEDRTGASRTSLHLATDWPGHFPNQPRVAAYLLAHGADINWVPDYTSQTPLGIASSLETRRETLVSWLRDRGASP